MAKKPTIQTPYLEFKFLKNVMIELGNGQTFTIPCEMKYQENPFAQRDPRRQRTLRSDDESAMILLPCFDLEKIHRVELQNERPVLPKQLGMSEAYHQRLCDQAYERAAKAKVANDTVREKVRAYAETGVIEVVCDPFEGEEEIEGLTELAEVVKYAEASDESETVQTSSKPRTKK